MFTGINAIYFFISILTGVCVQQNPSLSADDLNKIYRNFVETQLDRYESGNYSFQEGVYFRLFSPGQKLEDIDLNGEATNYFVHKLKNHPNCLGLKTQRHEIIVLECADKKPKKPGCFDIYSPGFVPDNQIFFVPDQEVENVCVRVLNQRCIGIITPTNWSLPFECTHKIKESVIPNTAITVPNNGPPPRV